MATNQSTSIAALFARFFWMFAGPATLLLLALNLADNDKGWFAPSSIAFLVVLAAVIFIRWLDGQTSEGEPVNANHLRKYTLIALAVGAGMWAVANLVGNHWPAS
jgi:hypothetical protein